jgi:hypothetical protein
MTTSITARLREASTKYGVGVLPVDDIKAALQPIICPKDLTNLARPQQITGFFAAGHRGRVGMASGKL